jgi:hypothetical protein
MIYNTLHSKLTIEKYEPHYKEIGNEIT